MTNNASDNLISSQILQDINDGLIAINFSGKIFFANPAAYKILEIKNDMLGRSFTDILPIEDTSNDEFFEIIFKAAEDQNKTHRQVIEYKKQNGEIITLELRSSYFFEDTLNNKKGIIISFSDITDKVKLEQKIRDSAVSFIVLLGGLCVWIFIYGLYIFFNEPFHINILTNILLGLSGVMFLIFRKFTTLELKDIGLSTENLFMNLLVGVVITITGFIALMIFKIILMHINPSQFIGKPFIDMSKYTRAEQFYVISVVWQEFITRGIVHQSLRRVIPGKNVEKLALILTALFFGALHIHMGIYYMFGASILLGILGFLYIKQNSIWGTCIPHYVLGVALLILNLV